MANTTKDLSIRIESDDGEVLLDQIITIDCSDTTAYGHGAFGDGVYGD